MYLRNRYINKTRENVQIFIIIYLLMYTQFDLGYSLPPEVIKVQNNNHVEISAILDNLLKGYDNSIRPDFGGPVTEIEVDIVVRSMGPISEVDMTYSMDCYFRQTWIDKRLAFKGNTTDTLALSISMLSKIWKPDTYFHNGKNSYLHTITSPNKFVRLYQDGRVLYSARLTIKAGCPMNLENFPMDTQRCPLKFGSFGYTSGDVIYRWNPARQISIADDMKLSQFDLIATPTSNRSVTIIGSDKQSEYSILIASFHLRRHMGNFLIQVYGPCVLLVVLSWVSFWLNREATADRVSLGITTVLTMTFLGLEARTDLPKVPYPTALDYFVFLSFSFIFATIIQFALVHYFTKYGSGECYFNADLNLDSSSDEDEGENKLFEPMEISSRNEMRGKESNEPISRINIEDFRIPNDQVIHLYAGTIPMKSGRFYKHWCKISCFDQTTKENQKTKATPTSRRKSSGQEPIIHRRKKYTPRFNSVSKIDRTSRVLFPFLFLTLNISYWFWYLCNSDRIEPFHIR